MMMKHFPVRRTLWIVVPLTLVLMVLWFPLGGNPVPQTHEIHINATDFAYEPGRVEINQGDHVVITLTASDVVHGFALDGHDIKTRVTPGVSERIEFTADQAGKFRFRCSVSCGALHPFMIGELVVTPNNPFWKAVAIVMVSAVGMFAYLWNFGKES